MKTKKVRETTGNRGRPHAEGNITVREVGVKSVHFFWDRDIDVMKTSAGLKNT